MAAATALLSDNAEPLKMRDIFLKRRDMVLNELRKIDGLKLNIPQGAFYIFPDCSNSLGKKLNGITIEDSAQLTESILEEVYVAAVSGAAFGAPNCIRLSYAASEEQLMEACRRLQTYFEKLV